MTIEYDGEVVCEIDGTEVDIVSFDETTSTGRKPVKTMNRLGRAKGSTTGSSMTTMKITAPSPATGEYAWKRMKDSLIVIYPVGNPTKRTSYQSCNVSNVSSRYQLDNEMVRDIDLYCLNVVDPV
jgi:hypothetical protein